MRVCLCIILYFCTLTFVSAQLPAQFVQFFKTYHLINPSVIGKDSTLQLNTANRSLLGAFTGVRTSYASIHFQLGKASVNKLRNLLGINFINDREGSFISRNRASLLYTVHIPLSSIASLNTGVSAGFINYSYKPSDIDGGGSAFAPNLDVGIWFQTINFNFGISSNQLIASKLRVISETYYIERYYTLNMDRKFELGPHLSLQPALGLRLLNKNTYTIEGAIQLLVQNNLLTALTYKYKRGASVSAGIEHVRVGGYYVRLLCSFYTPVSQFDYFNPQSLELSLGFQRKKRVETVVEEE